MSKESLSYKDAGVDIDAGNQLVERIKDVTKKTHRPEVMGGLGGFGALCSIPQKYKNPLLVSGTDGVGTKLRLAMDLNKHDSIGIDLVAMCVNDLIVQGAEPLFFLDYYATGKLDVDIAATVVSGIGKGCELSGCALIGGETAEMPGMYQGDDFDLAGFAVGAAERGTLLPRQDIAAGDIILGLASSGLHSNGFSLVRKLIADAGAKLDAPAPFKTTAATLGEALLTPTRLYVTPLLEPIRDGRIKALAHITGGGFSENIPRVLPKTLAADIDYTSWELPPVFRWLQEQGQVPTNEMYRTFNCGVGMVVVVPQAQVDQTLALLEAGGETPFVIGAIHASDNDEPEVSLEGLAS